MTGLSGERVEAAAIGQRDTLLIAAFAVALVFLGYSLYGDAGLDLADEGFLWYGVQRTLAGEVPLRDFQAYEPGRYAWCAAWGLVRGDGILAVREAIAAFGALGLFCGLMAVRRATGNLGAVLLWGPLLLLWAFPRHKVFESSLALIGVWAGALFLASPTRRAHLLAGVFVGLAACFGRNHGLYMAVGFLLLVLLSAWKRGGNGFPSHFASFAGGVVAGFAPVLLLMIVAPGYASALIDNVLFFLEKGSNLPLPYPWPWSFPYETLGGLARVGLALVFLLPVVVLPIGLGVAISTRADQLSARSVLIAAAVLGAFYMHHASVRSDVPHLAQSVHPTLIVACALPFVFAGARRWLVAAGVWGIVLVAGYVGGWATNPHVQVLRADAKWVAFDAAGDSLRVPESQARYYEYVRRLIDSEVKEAEILMAPFFVTFYPLYGKTSPVWRLYYLWPGDEDEQKEIMLTLEEEEIDWALIVDSTMDGRRDLLFRNSYPRVWSFLNSRYEVRSSDGGHILFRRR